MTELLSCGLKVRGAASARRRPRVKPLATLVSLALAQLAAPYAMADSGSGVDTVLGNALNPAGLSSARDRDPDGLGEAAHSRSPTGFMYPTPYSTLTPNRTDSGWLVNASVELGGLNVTGGRDAAKFGEYKSLKNGPYLNNFWAQAEKPDQALFVEVLGGGLGRSDQYLGLNVGRYNDWRIKAFYNETPHVFTSTYRNLWNGTGSGLLTLKSLPVAPVAPATAATTDIAIGNAVVATPYSTLNLVRKKGGIRLDMLLPGEWKFYASYTNEHREGARPFGMVFGGGGGAGNVEVPESINYYTHDFLTGVQWSSVRTSLNLQASASLFRNNIDTQKIESPLFQAAASGLTRFPYAEFDQYPDNDAYSVKAEIAHAMPEFYRARITGVLQATNSRQNDALIPYSPNGAAVINGVAGGSWDTVASLSRARSGASIDSRLADLGLSLSPTNALDVKAKLRHYQTSNGTEFWACNPLTGQWGRVINGASGNNGVFAIPNATNNVGNPNYSATAYQNVNPKCNLAAVQNLGLVPSAGNVAIRNIPYEYQQNNLSLGADYRIAKGQSINASVERENFDRQHRERARTWEDRIKLGYVNRALAGGTVRASLEQARRRGSTYIADPYEEFLSASMGPLPTVNGTNVTSWIHVNDLHRKFDLADRDNTTLNLRWNHMLRDDLDFGVALQAKDSRYPSSAYGRNGHQRQNSLNADLNWQPSPELGVYGFASHQIGHITQTGLQQNACVLGTTYFFRSDGSVGTAALTPAQIAAGITTVDSSTVTAANFGSLCGSASATSPLYTTSRAWSVTQDDTNSTAGVGLKWDFGKAKLDVNYNYSFGKTRIGYKYNAAALGLVTSGAPTAAQLTTLGLIGNGFPDQVIQTDAIDASLLVPFNKNAALRFLLRHEVGKIRDWHYEGVAEFPAPTAAQQVYLDSGPASYHATMLGVMLQLNW